MRNAGLEIHLIANAFWKPLDFELPNPPDRGPWQRWIDTSRDPPDDIVPWQTAPVVAPLRDAPVLTISDIEGFHDAGGMAQLFFERGQLRFSIRLDPVKRARLQLSSKLIILAKPQ